MEKSITRMASMLNAALEGSSLGGDLDVRFDETSRIFVIGESGVEVVLETDGASSKWRVREIYEVADIQEGGTKPVGATVALVHIGDEMIAAKDAVMRVASRRIDAALDAVA